MRNAPQPGKEPEPARLRPPREPAWAAEAHRGIPRPSRPAPGSREASASGGAGLGKGPATSPERRYSPLRAAAAPLRTGVLLSRKRSGSGAGGEAPWPAVGSSGAAANHAPGTGGTGGGASPPRSAGTARPGPGRCAWTCRGAGRGAGPLPPSRALRGRGRRRAGPPRGFFWRRAPPGRREAAGGRAGRGTRGCGAAASIGAGSGADRAPETAARVARAVWPWPGGLAGCQSRSEERLACTGLGCPQETL